MGLEDYRVGDRVAVRVGDGWYPGTVIKALDTILGLVTIDVDASTHHALVYDADGIRPLDQDANGIGIGSGVILRAPSGLHWRGDVVAMNLDKATVRLAGLDGQTVIVSKDLCELA